MSDEATPPHPDPGETTGATADAMTEAQSHDPLDLERIERDLAGVETALARLDDGTYWTDEITGEPIPDEVLAVDPVARRIG